MRESKKHEEVKITRRMLNAGEEVLLDFDPDHSDRKETVKRFFAALVYAQDPQSKPQHER